MESAMRSSEVIVDPTTPALDDVFGRAGESLVGDVALPALPPPLTERYRLIAARLDARLSPAPGQGRIVVVTSAEAGDGKTTSTLELGRALFERLGRRVLLVDAARRPASTREGLAARIGATMPRGLSELLRGAARKREALLRLGGGAGLLELAVEDEAGLAVLIRRASALRRRYEVVLCDTPPLSASADASLLARAADGVVLVVRHAITRKRAVQQALDALVDAPLLGTVLVAHGGGSLPPTSTIER